ncbi:MAG TPA: nucleotidyltransferase domain-containing protein [Jatrophihabitans sp.]|uniref:nucleotidyltransferase domain-containing protein n=1 Tax=Jatrophihabitans sp. TaxID=1932789 RepID=UPI002F121C07
MSPAGSTELLARLVELLRAEPLVLGAWLYGSHGRGEADAYSDLDVWVVTEDVDALLARWPALAQGLGPLALFEPLRRITGFRHIFPDWSGLDVWISPVRDLGDRDAENVRLLLDRGGLAARLPSGRPAPGPDVDKAAGLTGEFLRLLGQLPAVLARGDVLYGVSLAQVLRLQLIELMLCDLGLADPGGSGHSYRRLPADRRAALLRLPVIGNDLDSVRDAQLACAGLFVPLARQLCRERFPQPMYQALAGWLERELGARLPE